MSWRVPPCLQFLDAGSQQADRKLARPVKGTTRDRAGADGFAGMHGHFKREIAVAPQPERADALVVLYWRVDRAGVNDPCNQLVGAVLLHHHAHGLVSMEFARAGLTAEHLAITDHLPRLEQRAGFKILETPLQKFLGGRGAIPAILKADDHDDKPCAVLHGGAAHAVAALLGVAGLYSIRA